VLGALGEMTVSHCQRDAVLASDAPHQPRYCTFFHYRTIEPHRSASGRDNLVSVGVRRERRLASGPYFIRDTRARRRAALICRSRSDFVGGRAGGVGLGRPSVLYRGQYHGVVAAN